MTSSQKIKSIRPIFETRVVQMGTKIKAIIIDDEKDCIEVLSKQLEWVCPEVEIVSTARNASEGLEAIKLHRPQLIFLDIDLPDKNGFDMLKGLDTIDFEIIFTTAYDQYALEAYNAKALEYLLKPIEEEVLVSAIERVSVFIGNKNPLLQLEKYLVKSQATDQDKRINVATAEGIHFIICSDIIRCQAEGAYCKIFYQGDKQLLISKTLGQIENIIQIDSFLRVHHSHLINTVYIEKYLKAGGGEIIMKDGVSIPISRSKREFWKQWIRR